jgi:uncharacterized membrane protein YbhN (UPF0104 family)
VRIIGVVLLVVGIILLLLGLNASHALGSQISEVVRGTPTHRVIWFYIGAAVTGIPGLFLTLSPRRTS